MKAINTQKIFSWKLQPEKMTVTRNSIDKSNDYYYFRSFSNG